MIRGKYFTSMDDTAELFALRARVPEFCGANRDAFDEYAVYALVYDDQNAPRGCGRLYIDPESHFRIDYVGVDPDMRGRGMGDLVMRMLLYRAQSLSAASVRLLSPEPLIPFFARYGLREAENAAKNDPRELIADGKNIDISGTCRHADPLTGCSGDCARCEGCAEP